MRQHLRQRQHLRERLEFVPHWNGSLVAWTIRYIRLNVWRTRPFYDEDDLLQEAFLRFVKCCEYYPGVTKPAHFMALYQRTIINMIRVLASSRTTARILPDDSILECVLESEDCIRELEAKMLRDEAPAPVKSVLKAVRYRQPRLHRRKGLRETLNQYLCRLAGVDSDIDLRGIMARWITGVNQCSQSVSQ